MVSMEAPPRYLLLKFGAREHMERLLNQGELHLNILKYFRVHETNPQRKDHREGIEKIDHRSGGELFIKDPHTQEKLKVGDLTESELRFRNSALDFLNIYCLYIMDISKNDDGNIGSQISEKIKEFGDTAVIIYNDQEFIRRFERSVPKECTDSRKTVDYKPLDTFSGEVGPFVKDLSYEHQKELRLVVHNPKASGEVLKIYIGAINDIAFLMPVSYIKELSIERLDNSPQSTS